MCSFGERSAITTYFHIVIINRHSFIHSFIHEFTIIITLSVVKCQNPSSLRIFLTSLGYLVVLYVFSFFLVFTLVSLSGSFLLLFFIIDKDSSSHPSSLCMLIVLNPSSFLFLRIPFYFLFSFLVFFLHC